MNKRKRLLALICVALMTSEFLPTQVIANATLNLSEVKVDEELANNEKLENSESTENVVLEENKSNDTALEGEKTESKVEVKEENKTETKVEENKPVAELKNSIFTFFIKEKNSSKDNNKIKEFLSFKFNRETNKFEMDKNIEKDFSINKDENSTESNNESNELLEIKVIDGENKEKLNIKLLDNHDNSEELKKLLELEIKETDYIQINILNTDLNLKIEDDIYGDITKEKEDYSDGVSTLDYINNVRFQIKKDGINTIYNEAPVINGVNDIEVDSENKDALLQGISVTDDHDEIQNSSIQVSSKKLEENKTLVTYSVKDSWGRVTSASRNITYISKASENEVSPIALDTRTSTTATSLSDVVFTVKGVRYSNGKDERFKIKFDTNKKLIKVTDMDMRIMTTNNADEYFVFELYDSRMQLKKEVVIRGNERSEAANALNNVPYEIGDYIYVYHKEADNSKLNISSVKADQNGQYADWTSNIKRGEQLFKITNNGLDVTTNEAPSINIDPTTSGYSQTTENNKEVWRKTIKRGDDIDLSKGITISDTFDQANHIPLLLDHSVFNNMKLGEQTVIYTLTDSWGATVTKKAIITVEPKNDLEKVKFKFYSKGTNNELFNMTIDSVNHKIEVNRVSNDNQAIKGYSGAAFKIKIIDGVRNIVKREIAIRGTETGFSSALDRLDGYSYNNGDRISIWALNTEDVKIEGDANIESKPSGVTYENGLTNRDYLDNVRFEMNENKLKYIYNQAPEIIFDNQVITVTRGEDLDLKLGVTINDDHDKNITDLSSVKVVDFDKYKLGDQTVTYQYTDSWGRTGTATRTVRVLAKNKLEDNAVKMYKDNTDKAILSISFDDITRKLKVSDATTDTINGVNEVALVIKTYRHGNVERTLNINGNMSGIQIKNIIENLNINYEYGDMIEFVSTDPTKLNRVRIFGSLVPDSDDNRDKTNNTTSRNGETEGSTNIPSDSVTNNTNPYNKGFVNSDNMKNTRFQLTKDGLKAIYNHAPELNGLDELRIVKGTTNPDYKNGVTASDILDDNDNLTERIVVNSDEVKLNEVGVYGVNYTVTDSWGRTTSKDRVVHVVSKTENNVVSLYGDNDNKLFEIGFDTVGNKLIFKQPEISSGSGSGESNDTNQSTPKGEESNGNEDNPSRLASDNTNDKLFEIKVFNEHMTQVGIATLNDINNYESFKNQLKNINMYESYYVSLWAKDYTKLKISGDVIKTDGVTEENYLDGIGTEDQMVNVRFKSTEEGLEAIYNAAPVIAMKTEADSATQTRTINESIAQLPSFEHYLGETYKLTENMNVTDDKDTNLTVDNIETTFVRKIEELQDSENTRISSDNQDDNIEEYATENSGNTGNNSENIENVDRLVPSEVGIYIVTYKVVDSWGREAKATRELTVKKGIERNELVFGGHDKNASPQDFISFKLKINDKGDKNNVRISLEEVTNKQIHNEAGEEVYYTVQILNEDRSEICSASARPLENPNTANFEMLSLTNRDIPYGALIKITARQPSNFSIKGEILGDVKEDYSDGVNNKMNLNYVTFKITKRGLEAIYQDTDLNDAVRNVITNIDGGGLQAFKIKFDISDRGNTNSNNVGKLTIQKFNDPIIYLYEQNALKITLVREGEETITHMFNGTDTGQAQGFDKFNDKYVKDGDYIEFWAKRADRMFITGNVIDTVNNNDYAKGATDELFEHTRFYFTTTGIVAKYNKAPEIITSTADIYIGERFDFTLGVKVKDDHDDINEDGTLKQNTSTPNLISANTAVEKNVLNYTVTSKKTGDTDKSIDTNVLGERTVTYTYADSWGRTTTVERKVVVRPQLYKNRIQVYAEKTNTLKARAIADEVIDNGATDNSRSSNTQLIKQEPTFEIGFNTLTNKYEVINRKDEYLDIKNPRKDIFGIQIKRQNGDVVFEKTLKGNHKGTTTELDELNNISYEETDIIRVWRASSDNTSQNTSVAIPNLKITGNITKDSEIKEQDYSDGINDVNFMNNVGFKPVSTGLQAIYNKAPEINGFNDSVEIVEKGTTFSSIDDVTVTDDKDQTIPIDRVQISGTVNTNVLGTYVVTYTVTDSWNRTTSKVRTIKVVSKVKNNSIEVYNFNEVNDDLLFKIIFDADERKFKLERNTNSNLPDSSDANDSTLRINTEDNTSEVPSIPKDGSGETEPETPPDSEGGNTNTDAETSEDDNSDKIFRIKIFNTNGECVVNSSLTTTENLETQLQELTNYTFNIGDSISIWSSNSNKVKVIGEVEGKTHNYNNGLKTEEAMKSVRFRINENGLKEIGPSTPQISFGEGENNSVEVKRGDTVNYLNNITITDATENIPFEKVKYNTGGIDVNTIGEKTLEYSVTNSWGQTVKKTRKFNVVPKNEIDGVRLKLKSHNNSESNYLELGFDELTNKLKVYKEPTEVLYPNDEENILTISVYTSSGSTLKTLQIQGNQRIDEAQIRRINELEYQEGLFIGVETKYPQNLSITGNIEKVNNLNNHPLDLTNGIDNNELETFNNTRFKIGSTQIQAIYNEAPVITYPGQNETTKGLITVKKGEIYDYNKDLTVTDDHDGKIEASNVGVDESAVNYDEVGNYEITYIVSDSWGRDGTVTRPIKIVSNIVGNEIDIYSKDLIEQAHSNGNGQPQRVNAAEGDVVINEGETSSGDNEEKGDLPSENPDDSEATTPDKEGRVFTIGFVEEASTENTEESLTRDSTNRIKIKLEIKNKKDRQLDSKNEGKEVIKIVAYNENGTEKKGYTLSLNGDVTGNSDKLRELEKWELEYGDYISLYASDLNEESTGNNSSSSDENAGEVRESENQQSPPENPSSPSTPEKKEPTTTMIRITGGVINAREKYDSGSVTKDNIVNVRFQITDEGLEAVYNYAPNIYIDYKDFSKYLGETYKLTEGVNVYDDIDGTLSDTSITTIYRKTGELPPENNSSGNTQNGSASVNTRTISEGDSLRNENDSDENDGSENESNSNTPESNDSEESRTNTLPKEPGVYEVTYIAADSWGRTSSKTRTVTVKKGMDRHQIWFGGYSKESGSFISFKMKVVEDKQTGKLKIIFYDKEDKIVTDSAGDTPNYYGVEILNSDGNRVVQTNVTNPAYIGATQNPTTTTDFAQMESLTTLNIEYGYKIKFIATQTPGFSIHGEISGDVYTDYSQGVYNKYYLDYVTFEITKEGLKAKYNDPTIRADENLFTIVDGGGLNPFKIKVTPTNNNSDGSIGSLMVEKKSNEILYDNRNENDVLKMNLKRANSSRANIEKTFSGGLADQGDNATNLNAFNTTVYDGDYLEISFKRPSIMYVMGDYHSSSNAKVDYNEGAKDEDNLENVRFYFKVDNSNQSKTTENKPILLPVYNEAPEITGMDFIRVPVNETYNLLEGVETSDQIDDALNKKVKLVIKNEDLGINKTITQNATKNSTSNGIRSIFNKLTNNTTSNGSETEFNKNNSNDNNTITNEEVVDITTFNYKFEESGIFNIEYQMTDSWGRTTTEYKTIQVYGSPEIDAKKDVVTDNGNKTGTVTIELNSMKDNIEAYMESYFRSLVSISDVEDDDKDLKVEIEGEVNPNKVGTYPVNYKVTDTHGNITMYKINVNVVKTIKATVTTDIPFQVVTNLLKENGTVENIEDRFVSSKIRIKNNNPNSKMEVYVKGLNKSEGDLELVNGDNFEFNSLNKFESLRKMALGLYFIKSTNVGDENIREGENSELPTETTKVFTKESPLWLTTDMTQTKITTMKEASGNKSDITLPSKNNSDTGTTQPPEGGDSEEGNEEQPSSRTDSNDQEGENPPFGTEEDEKLKNPNYYIKDYGDINSEILEFGLTAKYGNNFAGGKVRGKFKLIFEFR